MANVYDIGDRVRCTGTITDINSSNVDPDTVFAQVRTPGGNVTSYEYTVDAELVRSETGVYYIDIDAVEHGDWWYRIYGVATGGTNQGAIENNFLVNESKFV